MSTNTKNFDCRSIHDGRMCKHLSPWNIGKKDELARVCTCKALNIIVFPKYRNLGEITQELLNVTPVFHCPVMQKLRLKNEAPKMIATINGSNFKTWNND